MTDTRFLNHMDFAAYLVERGIAPAEKLKELEAACAAFEVFQRGIGRDKAKEAMLKAVDKVR